VIAGTALLLPAKSVGAEVVVRVGPPPIRVETVPPAPSRSYFWAGTDGPTSGFPGITSVIRTLTADGSRATGCIGGAAGIGSKDIGAHKAAVPTDVKRSSPQSGCEDGGSSERAGLILAARQKLQIEDGSAASRAEEPKPGKRVLDGTRFGNPRLRGAAAPTHLLNKIDRPAWAG
jgi:hypothetical protein